MMLLFRRLSVLLLSLLLALSVPYVRADVVEDETLTGPKRDLLEERHKALRSLQSLTEKASGLHSTVSELTHALKHIKETQEYDAGQKLSELLGKQKPAARRNLHQNTLNKFKPPDLQYATEVAAKQYKKKKYQGKEYVNKMKKAAKNVFG